MRRHVRNTKYVTIFAQNQKRKHRSGFRNCLPVTSWHNMSDVDENDMDTNAVSEYENDWFPEEAKPINFDIAVDDCQLEVVSEGAKPINLYHGKYRKIGSRWVEESEIAMEENATNEVDSWWYS